MNKGAKIVGQSIVVLEGVLLDRETLERRLDMEMVDVVSVVHRDPSPLDQMISERDFVSHRLACLDPVGIPFSSLKDNQAYYMTQYLRVLNERIELWPK